MKGKNYWWCDGCDREVPQSEAYWLIVAVTTNVDDNKSITDSRDRSFHGGDFCDECMAKMAGVIERKR